MECENHQDDHGYPRGHHHEYCWPLTFYRLISRLLTHVHLSHLMRDDDYYVFGKLVDIVIVVAFI